MQKGVSVIAFILASALIAFAIFGGVSRRTRVVGVLVPTAGALSVQAREAGALIDKHVEERQVVRTGDLLFVAPAQAHSTESVLANATIFKVGLVGMVAHVSDEEIALAALLKHADAQTRLSTLLRSASSNEGKLYALCGMRRLSKSLYVKAAQKTTWDKDHFNVMRADVVVKVPVKDQLAQMRKHGCQPHSQ